MPFDDQWPTVPSQPSSPTKTPTRASRSQGITNEVSYTKFIRDSQITFAVGQPVIISADAPTRQKWLNSPLYLIKKKKSKGSAKGKMKRGEDYEGWRHEDGLKGGEKVAMIVGLYEDGVGNMMAKLRWLARPGAVWDTEGPDEEPDPYEVYYTTDSQYLDDLSLSSSASSLRTPLCTDSIPISYILSHASILSCLPTIPPPSNTFFVRRVLDAKPRPNGEFLCMIDWEEVRRKGVEEGDWDVEGSGVNEAEEREREREKKEDEKKKRAEERKRKKEAGLKEGVNKEKVVRKRTLEQERREEDSSSDEEADNSDDPDVRSGASESESDGEEEDDGNSSEGSSPTKRRHPSSPSKSRSKRRRTTHHQAHTKAQITKTALARSRTKSDRLAAFKKSSHETSSLPPAFSLSPSLLKLPPWERAKSLLHVSATPESLPRRDTQRDAINDALGGCIIDGRGECLYVHGVPGTGKTATVHSVVRGLQANEHIPKFQFVEINGMKISDPTTAFSLLWESISGEKAGPKAALSSLEEHFQTPDPSRRTTVVLVDELDQMITKKQEVIYNFFNWPHVPHSKLIVIAIANTMDLPERELSHKIQSRLGKSNRFPFPTYSWQDLYAIIGARLEGLEVMEKKAVERVAKMVAGVSGDARRALDIARRTVEKVEQRNEQDGTKSLCGMNDVFETYKEMTNYGSNLFVKRASVHQQLFLLSLSRVISKAGVPEVELQQVFAHYYESLKRTATMDVVSQSELFDIVADLHNLRLIATENQRNDIFQRVRSLVEESDLKGILKDIPEMERYVQ